MRELIQQAKDRPVVSSIAAAAVSVTAILGGAKALDIRLIPWATADEISNLKKQIDSREDKILAILQQLGAAQKASEANQATLLREFWQKRLEEAEEELAVNPSSKTAKAQKLEAKQNIEKIDLSLTGVPASSTLPAEGDQ